MNTMNTAVATAPELTQSRRGLRVLQLIETGGPGGAEQFVCRLGEALEREGITHQVWLLKSGWLHQALQRRGLDVRIVSEPRLSRPWTLLRFAWQVRQGRFDAIHSHEFLMNVVAALVALPLRIPHVATIHGCNYWGDRWHRRLLYRMVSRLSAMVTVSSHTRDFAAQRLGLPARRLNVIANGLKVGDYAPDPGRREAARQSLSLSPDTLAVMAVGSLYPVKGHRYLLPAFARMMEQRPQSRLLLVGRGGEQASLQAQAAALGIDHAIDFLGQRDDVPELLQAADLFVMPSLQEGLPLALLEAMASGKAVVASAVGGMPQVIAESGRTVAPRDSEALAAALVALAEDAEQRDCLGRRARRRVMEQFGEQQMLEAYLKLYRRTR